MKNKAYGDVFLKAQEYDKELYANAFQRMVLISHQDGTMLTFLNAFLMSCGEWIVVFTEHTGFHIFHPADLYFWRQYEYVNELLKEL